MQNGATQMRLSDKVIVLGGGAGGTGEQISMRLAAEGERS